MLGPRVFKLDMKVGQD